MLEFTREIFVGIGKRDEDTLMVHGILDDNIYALELHMEVKLPGGEIVSAKGEMKRFTTPECKRAESKLANIVGLNIYDLGFDTKVKKAVGREGCRHMADLLLECCRAIPQALIQIQWQAAKAKGGSKEDFLKSLFETEPRVRDKCMVYSRESDLVKRLGLQWG